MAPGRKNLELKYFDIKSMARNATCLIYGRRNSGKSVFCKDLMYHLQDIPKGLVISGSEEHKPFYSEFIPDSYIFYKYDSEIIRKVSAQQRAIVKKHGGPCPKNNFFMIMDDCISDLKLWKQDETLREFFFQGRHMNLFFVIIMQYCLALGPDLRNNFDYIFIFRDNIKENQVKLYKHFAGVCGDFKTFEAIMTQATENKACIVIDNRSLSANIEDCVFVYKAELNLSPFKCGSSQYWRTHDENYKPPEDEEDMSSSSKHRQTSHRNSETDSGPTGNNTVRVIFKTKEERYS